MVVPLVLLNFLFIESHSPYPAGDNGECLQHKGSIPGGRFQAPDFGGCVPPGSRPWVLYLPLIWRFSPTRHSILDFTGYTLSPGSCLVAAPGRVMDPAGCCGRCAAVRPGVSRVIAPAYLLKRPDFRWVCGPTFYSTVGV